MTAEASLTVNTTEPGWLAVPSGLSRSESEEWVQTVTAQLRQAWGEQWQNEHDSLIPGMLREALEARGDEDVFVFDVWPIFEPARARVRIAMMNPESMPDWESGGFEVVPYDDAPVGPGVIARRVQTVETERGEIEILDWWALFSDGNHLIGIQLETLPVAAYMFIMPGLFGLLQTLEGTLSDGRPFHARPPQGFVFSDDTEWPDLDLINGSDQQAVEGDDDDR